MKKTKKKVARPRRKIGFEKELEKDVLMLEKNIEKEVKIVEKWVIERRKFFIKLFWVILLVAALWIISSLFLKVKGVGL